MNSPTGKQPPVSQLEKTALLEQAAASLHYKSLQLQRTLWLAATNNGGTLVLNERAIDLLWRLKFERTPDGMLTVQALKAEEAQETDIEASARVLMGTNALLSDYASAHERLKEYPIEYLEFRLSRYIRFSGDSWKSVADPMRPSG